jgi:predicted dehydrogenase
MQLALLGLNSQTLALLRSAVEAGHALTVAADVEEAAHQIAALAPAARLNEPWESLLIGDRADLVLVAGPPQDRAWNESEIDRLRKLVQEGLPVLLAPPLVEVNLAYELEMIRRERGGLILTASPAWSHPGVERLRHLVDDSTAAGLGALEQIVFERRISDRSRPAVLAAFVQDAAILRRLLGAIKTVNATGGPASEYRDPMAGGPKPVKPLSSVAVHLTGTSPFSARWSIAPPANDLQASLLVEGALGRAQLDLFGGGRADEFVLQTPAGERQEQLAVDEGQFWASLETALQRHSAATLEAQRDWHTTLSPPWIDVCHDLEAAEAIDRSLIRGRTVNVTTDEPSEEEAFKGIMAAGGCLTLVVSLGLFLLAGAVEALQLPIRDLPVWRFSPLLPLAPIVLFLLLQLFRLAVPPRRS